MRKIVLWPALIRAHNKYQGEKSQKGKKQWLEVQLHWATWLSSLRSDSLPVNWPLVHYRIPLRTM
jgi:hypothetical protein